MPGNTVKGKNKIWLSLKGLPSDYDFDLFSLSLKKYYNVG